MMLIVLGWALVEEADGQGLGIRFPFGRLGSAGVAHRAHRACHLAYQRTVRLGKTSSDVHPPHGQGCRGRTISTSRPDRVLIGAG